jgi:hypothetical protein
MANDKQLTANRLNAQKSTDATSEAGKEIIKYNALKHGILKSDMSAYEDSDIEEIKEELFADYKPTSKIQGYILERVAIHVVKLKRIIKAEKEVILSFLHPDMPLIKFGGEKAYYPKIDADNVKILTDIYQRYEITEENRLYKALEQLKGMMAN